MANLAISGSKHGIKPGLSTEFPLTDVFAWYIGN